MEALESSASCSRVGLSVSSGCFAESRGLKFSWSGTASAQPGVGLGWRTWAERGERGSGADEGGRRAVGTRPSEVGGSQGIRFCFLPSPYNENWEGQIE